LLSTNLYYQNIEDYNKLELAESLNKLVTENRTAFFA